MPLQGLFDFDGTLFLAACDDPFGRHVFPLVETAGNGVDPLAGPFGPVDPIETDPGIASPSLDLFGGLFGGSDEPGTPSAPSVSLNDWLFGLFGGGDDTPGQPSESEGHWLTVGLLGGRVWVPAEPEAAVDELNSLIICPAEQPSSSDGSGLLLDLFGL